MKKVFIVFLLLLVAGCEKDFNNIVEVPVNSFQVSSVITPDNFIFNPSDSLLTLAIKFQSSEGVGSVHFDIYSPKLDKMNSGGTELLDNGNMSVNGDAANGDNIYSNKFAMSRYFLNGRYTIKYYVNLNSGELLQVAQQTLTYFNGQSDAAPVISNLVIPDTVSTGQQFKFTVSASDSNGLADISEVYYELYRPDGSQVINSQGVSKFPLSDSGDAGSSGDLTAGDGVYTNMLTFPSGVSTGDWTFKFHATDTAGKLSNEISKIVTVK